MVKIKPTSNRPYGAWELKISYQRNMLLSLALVTLFVLGAVGAAYGLGLLDAPPVVTSGGTYIDPPDGRFYEEPPIKYEPDPVVAGGEGRRTAEELPALVIPEPVADSMLMDEAEVVIASKADLAKRVDWGDLPDDPGEDGAEGEIGFRGNGSDGGGYLPPDIFQPLEVYPRLITEHPPKYPLLAKKLGLEGSVWLQVLINKEGRVIRAEVLKTSEISMLDDAALEAAWKNRFTPGIQSKRAVACWVKYKVEFVLSD